MQNSKTPILSALCAAMLCGAGFLTAAKAENLTESSYTSGSYTTDSINPANHTITLIGGASDSSRAEFKNFTNETGASITKIGGYAKITGAFTNQGSIGSIGENASFTYSYLTFDNQKGSSIGSINGNANFTGKFVNEGSVGDISGNATFSTSLSNQNGGKIASISGSVKAERLINGDATYEKNNDYIGEISGGTFGSTSTVSSGSNVACKTKGNCIENIGTINKISGGTFQGGFNNQKSRDNKYEGVINEISGGNFEQLGNDGTIAKISGGKFSEMQAITQGEANKAAIRNYGTIGEITGSADIESLLLASGYTDGISETWGSSKTDTGTGEITAITGGKIKTLTIETDSQFLGRARIVSIDGGEITTLTSGKAGTAESGGSIENITGGTITTLNNISDSKITNISGGNFGTLNNESIVENISGGKFTSFNNKTNATIANISGTANVETLTNEGAATISGVLTGDITNSGTVTFAMKNASNFGQLVGNLKNESGGKVIIDARNAGLAKEYPFITGEISGLNASNFTLESPSSRYFSLELGEDFKSININKTQAFIELQAQLGQSKGNIAERLLANGVDIDTTSAINDTDDTIKQSYVSLPQHIISNFKANSVNNTPLGQGLGMAFAPTVSEKEFKPTASADLLRFDNGYVVNSLVNEPKIEFFANPFYGELRGNGVKGSLGGVNLGLGYLDENYALQGSFNYAYATSSQDLATQSTDTTAYMFQVGLLGQLFFADLVEIDINANYLLGKFKMSNIWLADSTLNSSSKFDNHQGNVGVAAGLRFGSEFSIKPFVGLQNYFESQGKYSVLGFESEKYSDYALNGVAGIEGRAKIGDLSFLYARVSGEFNFVESQKELFMVNKELNAELKYANETYKNSVSAGLGAQIFATDSVKLSIEGLYKYHDSGLHYYGGSLGVRVAF